uniref:G-protein coupled receptors family 1 profile domain-containing protein n=1 Tax=Globodera rostochiensis TaxID=31243 RepID=A0A914I1B6_GLORO
MSGEICDFLNITITAKFDASNLTTKFELLDTVKNFSLIEWIFSSMIHQLTVAKCSYQTIAVKVESVNYMRNIIIANNMGFWSTILLYVTVPGIFAMFSIIFNISLVLITFTKIKDHKVCNWLIAFDSLCQLFVVSPFITNLIAHILQYSSVDYRICFGTLVASTVASYASFLALYLISAERLLIVLFPIEMNWIRISTVRRFSLIASLLCTFFGILMAFNVFNVLTTINLAFERMIYCNSGLYSDVMNKMPSLIILSLCVFNYVAIFGLILWRHFKLQQKKSNQLASISSSDLSMRKMLRSVFLLLLVILIGWLIASVARNQIISIILSLITKILDNNAKSADQLYIMNNITSIMIGIVTCVPIWASASGAPILMLSENYRNAYKKMFKRKTPTVGPLFTN